MSAENPKTETIYPHYRYGEFCETTEQFEIPVKLTYTISLNKRVYMPGDEVVVDMTFEYITSSPKYMPNDRIDIYVHSTEKPDAYKREEFRVFALGENSGILNDKNKVFKTRTKVVFSKKYTDYAVSWYYITVTGKNLYGRSFDNDPSEKFKNFMYGTKEEYSYTLYPLLDESETLKDKDLEDEDNLEYKIFLNK